MWPTTDAEKVALTSRPRRVVSAGAEIVNVNGTVVEDISDVMFDAGVEYDNRANGVHATCDIELTRALDWGNVRVRLWQNVNGVRRNQGVFVLTKPKRQTGRSPALWKVRGYGLLHNLQDWLPDTLVMNAGTGYLDDARQVLTDAGMGGLPARFSGDGEALTLPKPMVWLLHRGDRYSYLRVGNDLLAATGYGQLWVDGDGRPRADPHQDPVVKGVEWAFDLTDPQTRIVRGELTLTEDTFDDFNFWRFIRDGLDGEPAVGAGAHVVDRSNGGPVHAAPTEWLTAADQASLVAQAEARVAADTRDVRTLEFTTAALPVFGHGDVVSLTHPELGVFKLAVASWSCRSLRGRSGAGDVQVKAEVLG